jgi:hypothetical protein
LDFIIISPNAGAHTGPSFELHIKRTGHNPPLGASANWWVLTIVNDIKRTDLILVILVRDTLYSYIVDRRCLINNLFTLVVLRGALAQVVFAPQSAG